MFQSTRPRGARPLIFSNGTAITLCFNPRARGGRDAKNGTCVNVLRKFQSTRPRGARPKIPPSPAHSWLFQSTRPRGARLCISRLPNWLTGGFNPRARGGRDGNYG